MQETMRHQLIVITVAATVLLTNLGGPRLWDRDEPRNAGCAAEMLARGDWVVPVFNGELRTHKPVLLYWLMMSAYAVLGIDEFSARCWSAVLGMATVLMTYHLGRRLFDASAGFWSAITLAPALMFGVAGRAATPDSVLIACSTFAIFLYATRALPRPPQPSVATELSFSTAILVYGAMGLAILAKGPVGLVLPTAVIGMFLLITRLPSRGLEMSVYAKLRSLIRPFEPRHFLATCWSMRPVTAMCVSLAVALPWYWWVHYRTGGAWTEGFFLEHNLHRATQAMEGHRGNVLFYPAALAVGFFPWSVFLAPMILGTLQHCRRNREWNAGYLLATCWVGVYVVLFSFAKTKLPSYITPCYPGVALLMGAFLSRLLRPSPDVSAVWLRLATGVATLVGLVLLVTLPVVAHHYLPGEEWLGVVGVAPLLGGVLGWAFVAQRDYRRMACVYGAASVAFSTSLLALVPQRVDSFQRNNELLAVIYAQSDSPKIGYFGHLEPTWIFYGGQSLTNVTTSDDPRPLTPEVSPTDQPQIWRPQPKQLVSEFLREGDEHFLITTRHAWQHASSEAPPDVEILAKVPYFLRGQQLIVVGRRPQTPTRDTSPHLAEEQKSLNSARF